VLLLAIDTATPAVTVAVHDGRAVLARSTSVDPRRHGELLAPAVRDVLASAGRSPADLTRVVVGVGPGPYTGLRVGIATAATLAAALGIPVSGLCSLDALAWRAAVAGPFAVATDARRREVYWAVYADRTTRTAGPDVGRPADVVPLLGGVPVLGPATELYDLPGSVPSPPLDAAAVAELALLRLEAGDELPPPRPLYLRRPDATPPAGRKRVLA
jgi:tRNA threonylcarbamoyl adenosine modification protein YeaZ